jgi:hypothetical protein
MSFSFSGPAYQEKKRSQGQALFGGALRCGLDSASSPDSKDPLRGKQQTETRIFRNGFDGNPLGTGPGNQCCCRPEDGAHSNKPGSLKYSL